MRTIIVRKLMSYLTKIKRTLCTLSGARQHVDKNEGRGDKCTGAS